MLQFGLMEFSSTMSLFEFTVLSLLYVASFAMFLDSIFKGTIFLVLARKDFNMLSINYFVDNKKQIFNFN